MKTRLQFIAIIVGFLFLFGGCVRLKYWAFKQKYPHASVWSFFISG